MQNCKPVTPKNDGGHLSEVAVYESFQPREFDWEILVFLLEGRLWKVVANPGRGGGTLGIYVWGCASGTLEPLTYTRASSAGFCYPILE